MGKEWEQGHGAAAIEDGFEPLGVTIDSPPQPPSRLCALVRAARAEQD